MSEKIDARREAGDYLSVRAHALHDDISHRAMVAKALGDAHSAGEYTMYARVLRDLLDSIAVYIERLPSHPAQGSARTDG